MRALIWAPAFVAAVVITLAVTAAAHAAAPPDPLVKAYGKPSATYMKHRGRYLYVCRAWLYRRQKVLVASIEQCVAYGLAHPNAPKPTGPSS